MRHLFLISALLLYCSVFAQSRVVQTYPVLANLSISVAGKESIDANQLYKGQIVRFSFAVINPSQHDVIKKGTCYLQIDLGNQLQPPQNATIKTALNNYFSWSTSADENGKLWLIGKLTMDLPADFADIAFVDLQCTETGSSTIVAQWTDGAKTKQGVPSSLGVTIKKNKPKE